MKKKNNSVRIFFLCIFNITLLMSCGDMGGSAIVVDGQNIRIEYNDELHSRVIAKFDRRNIQVGNYQPSEFILVDGDTMKDFHFVYKMNETISDNIGAGKKYVITGNNGRFTKEISVVLYDDFPTMAIYKVSYTNNSETSFTINKWINNHYSISNTASAQYNHSFWSYQSESTSRRADWILPVEVGFSQQNYMGMNNSDYGGGTPVSNIWRPDIGIAVGHVETVPKLVSIPVDMPTNDGATLGVEYSIEKKLEPGQTFTTFNTFVSVHRGDYFATLVNYRDLMIRKGIPIQLEQSSDSYESQWCAWGYERDFTMQQIYGTLPKVRELGYHWAVLDDGWQNNVGDWELNRVKYPRGERDMQVFVKYIHDQGLRSKLWWAPMAVHPDSRLYRATPEYLILDKEGKPVRISWWNSFYLCPAYKPVRDNAIDLVTTFMKTWGYHGLKIDGQHLNAAPPCYNPAHNHSYPEESVEAVSEYFRGIFETATSIVPDALIEICPCGTAYSFFNMPYMTQGVASDPTSSWQVRHKGKTLKALMGPSTPYFGDHVELTRGGEDFASQIGIGAVIGTKFTWPVGAMPGSAAELFPEREEQWSKWSKIYENTRLPEGIYLGELYDIGFDRPETHAIKKNDRMYYAFYPDQNPGRDERDYEVWSGTIELRGLENRTYVVYDYVNKVDLGTIRGIKAKLDVEFSEYLLLELKPQ
jgi:alpha-galactosidase